MAWPTLGPVEALISIEDSNSLWVKLFEGNNSLEFSSFWMKTNYPLIFSLL